MSTNSSPEVTLENKDNNSNCTSLEKQYKLAIEARDKLNDNFHKWMTYYYVANGAALVAVTTLYSKNSTGNFVMSLLAVLVCIFWNLSCKGYYFWSKNWISIIKSIERELIKNDNSYGVYSVFKRKVKQDDNKPFNPVIDVISNLYTLYINTILAGRKATKQRARAMISTVVGTFFTIDAINNRSTLGTIASAGFTGLSYDNYLKAGATVEELNNLSKRIVGIIDEFKNSTSAFVKHEIINLDKFKQLTVQCEAQVVNELKTEEQKKAEHIEATKPLSGIERQKYIAQKSQELGDETHPFHFQKSEALYLFEEKKYSKALPIINYALSLYSEDTDLKKAKEKCLQSATTKDALIFCIPWLLCVAAASNSFKEKVGFSFLTWTLIFSCIIAYRSWKRSTKSTPI